MVAYFLVRKKKKKKKKKKRASVSSLPGDSSHSGIWKHRRRFSAAADLTAISNMSESAEAVAADVSSKRSAVIEITNVTNSYCLINPRVHLENGETYNPPQPTVRPLKTEVCTFTKSGGKATGSVGVLTYDLFERSQNDYIETLAIMFSIPWDYNLYKNWFAVGIYKKGRNCDKDLYKEMYYEKKQREHGFVREEANGSGINYVGNYLDIKATMCPLGNSIMKVEVWDKIFTSMGQHAY